MLPGCLGESSAGLYWPVVEFDGAHWMSLVQGCLDGSRAAGLWGWKVVDGLQRLVQPNGQAVRQIARVQAVINFRVRCERLEKGVLTVFR